MTLSRQVQSERRSYRELHNLPSLDQRLKDEVANLRQQIESLQPSPRREALRRKLEQVEHAVLMNGWLNGELKPPTI